MVSTAIRMKIVAFLFLSTTLARTCPKLPPRESPPRDVNDLRIDDFKVVMAMGDSMTAGFNGGEKADMREHRGLGFSIGGDKSAVTLPNLITATKSNGELVGAAIGTLQKPTLKATCPETEVDACRLSAAVDGSDLQDLIDLQVKYLNLTLSTASWAVGVDVRRDWKLLTIFSGLDDAVFYNATDATKHPTSPELFATNLNTLLQAVFDVFPRTFVNIMLLPENFDPRLTTARLTCKFFKWYSNTHGIHWTDTKLWVPAIRKFNEIIKEVANAWNSKGLKEFGVSPQPFMQDAKLEQTDLDTLDCFHPNLASHQGMAVALWNNMLASSFSKKSTNWKQTQNITCPTVASRLVLNSIPHVVV